MTPVSLNPPEGPSLQGQNQLFSISPNNQDSPTFFNYVFDPRQTIEIGELRDQNDHQDHKLVLREGSSSNHQLYNSSFNSPQPVMHDPSSARDPILSLCKMEEEDSKNDGHGSAKWMSSKMRLMKKMMRPIGSSSATDKTINSTTPSPRLHNHGHENRYSQRSPRYNNSSNNTTRVCSDCKTSSTPLWRSGPMGPKSLCNACGIRQRKARRAMIEAANGSATPMNASPTKTRVHNKEKKPRTNHFAKFKNKNKYKSTAPTTVSSSSEGVEKLECFATSLRNNSDFQQVFPWDEVAAWDEVAEAALLLMDISCGFVHS